MAPLHKTYKGNNLVFHPDKKTPGFYVGYKQNGELFEERSHGWGWTKAAFFLDQLDTLESW